MGRYMIGRQCVSEQGNRKLRKKTRAQRGGQDEGKWPKRELYKQSQGPPVRTNVEALDTGPPTNRPRLSGVVIS